MEYRINFSSPTSPDMLVGALRERFGVAPSKVCIGLSASPGRCSELTHMVSISPGSKGERYGCRMRAGAALAEQVGHLHPAELAAILCVGLTTKAVIPGGRTGWCLVTEDGHVAEVVVDDDLIGDEGIVVVAALAVIPTMPHIPVRSTTWCDDRLPKRW